MIPEIRKRKIEPIKDPPEVPLKQLKYTKPEDPKSSKIKAKLAELPNSPEALLTQWKLRKLNLWLRETPLSTIEDCVFNQRDQANVTGKLQVISSLLEEFIHDEFFEFSYDGNFLLPYYILVVLYTKKYKKVMLNSKSLNKILKGYFEKIDFCRLFKYDNLRFLVFWGL